MLLSIEMFSFCVTLKTREDEDQSSAVNRTQEKRHNLYLGRMRRENRLNMYQLHPAEQISYKTLALRRVGYRLKNERKAAVTEVNNRNLPSFSLASSLLSSYSRFSGYRQHLSSVVSK